MSKTILLSAGGTGGHLFPAEALAHELKSRGWSVHLATDDRANRFAGTFPADEIHTIPSATMGSRNPIAVLKTGWTIWQGVRLAGAVIKRINPSVVVGFGGYPTLPPLFAATRWKVPSIVHEQNAVMGRANKVLAPRVTAIAGGFLDPKGSGFADKSVLTGNPVRPAVLEAAQVPYQPSGDGKPFNLVVFGGSQGAQFFSDAIPAAIAKLPASERKRLTLVQQARKEDEARVADALEALGVKFQVAPFFSNMAEKIAGAQLVISRAGASTVSELGVIGRPSILVPYPHALDHDQAANAAALAAAGGAEVHPQSTLSPEKIAELLKAAITGPQRLSTMAAAARSAGMPNATQLLADLTEAIASGKSVEQFRKEAGA